MLANLVLTLLLQDMSVAVTTMNTALKHKIRKLQDGSVSGVTAGLPEVQVGLAAKKCGVTS